MRRDVERYGLRVGFFSFLAQPAARAGVKATGVVQIGLKPDALLRAQRQPSVHDHATALSRDRAKQLGGCAGGFDYIQVKWNTARLRHHKMLGPHADRYL